MASNAAKKTRLPRRFYLYPLVFALAYSQEALFSSNQNTKFISGLARAGYGDIAADWMAGITDPFPLFSLLLKWQYQLLGLQVGTHLAFFLLAGAYGLLGVYLAKNLLCGGSHKRAGEKPESAGRTKDMPIPQSRQYRRTRFAVSGLQVPYCFRFVSGFVLKPNKSARPALWLFSLLWLFVHTVGLRDFFQNIVPAGLAGQYMLGDYYQPCCFGVLLLAAVAAYTSGRLLTASICLIAAPLFHPAYLISSALIAAALIMVPANRILGIPWRRRLVFLLLTACGVGTYALWNLTTLTSGDPALRDAAYRLMAETRIPQHALPSHWHMFKALAFFIAGSTAAWLGRKQLIGQVLGVLTAAVAAAVLWALVAFNPTVAVAAPWRVSSVLAPLSLIVLLAAAAQWLTRKNFFALPLSPKDKKWLAAACICACLGGILHLALDYNKKEARRDYGLVRFLTTHHRHGYQYLIPPKEKYIRLEAGVPVYATLKSHPTKDSEFLAWHKRIETAKAVYAGSASTLLSLLKERAITHVIWPAEQGDFPFSAFGNRIYGDNYFSAWDLGKELR